MARLTAPCLSLGASGTIAKTLVFANWKGIPYARVHVIPYNPRTTAQDDVRNTFLTLTELWKRMPTLGRESYAASAEGRPWTDRNKHIKENLVALRDGTFFQDYEWSIAGGQAVPPTAIVATPQPGKINISTFTLPAAPVGHTIYSRVAACIEHGTPKDGILRSMYCGERLGATLTLAIDPVPAGTYNIGAWIKWTRDSDSKIFYSSFLITSAIVP